MPVDITCTFAKPGFHIETMNLAARVVGVIGLGVVFPRAVLAPLVDTGLGEHNVCVAAFAPTPPQNQPQVRSQAASSAPPAKPATR